MAMALIDNSYQLVESGCGYIDGQADIFGEVHELMKEARVFSIYYGRVELMSEGTRQRYEAFCEKCRIYEEEKHENRQK